MRHATLLLIITSAFGGMARAVSAQASSTDSIAVTEAVRGFHNALARGDSAAALALLAEDAVILEAGEIESRAEYRAHHLSADIQFAAAIPSAPGPLSVMLTRDVAWVTSTSATVGTFQGRAINGIGAELVVLTRTPRGWRIRAIHWSSRRGPTP